MWFLNKRDIESIFIIGMAIIVLVFANILEVGYLLMAAVIICIWASFHCFKRLAILHPINIFNVFLGSYVIVGLLFININLREEVPYFSYMMPATFQLMNEIATETVIVVSFMFLGYLLQSIVSTTPVHKNVMIRKRKLDDYWWIYYLIGMGAFLSIILLTGGLSNIVENLSQKGERAAGRGWLVVLHYVAYIGALLWYRKNIFSSPFVRYVGLILLLAPLLLYGNRTEFIIIILAALYVDETIGKQISWLSVLLVGGILVFVSALYQMYRVGAEETNYILAVYKDLSMSIGYGLAKTEGLFGKEFHFDVLYLSMSPFIPGLLREHLDMPMLPNNVFTIFIFPFVDNTTFSMGVMGEANYILPYRLSVLYYTVLGFFFAWSHRVLRNYSVISAAVIGGATIRFAKGGITAGTANVLIILWALAVTYVIYLIWRKSYEKHYLHTKSQSGT